jgi:ribosome-binding ATPase YchF (GTP1/OBG family)
MHVDGRVNPVEDVATINFELALSDLLQVEKRLERVRKGKAKV